MNSSVTFANANFDDADKSSGRIELSFIMRPLGSHQKGSVVKEGGKVAQIMGYGIWS